MLGHILGVLTLIGLVAIILDIAFPGRLRKQNKKK